MSAATQSIPEASAPRWMSLTRWHAFAIHLVLSFLVFFSLVAVMYFYWFPGELFFLDGGWQGLKLVALVDLVLGPLLTLLLFVPTKPKVLMDMAFIAVFQIAALVYGAITTFDQRTIAMVYTDKMFASLSNAALEVADKALLEKEITPKDISKLNPGRPDLLYTRSPTQETYANYLEEMFNGYPEPHERSDKLQSIHAGREEMKKYAVTES